MLKIILPTILLAPLTWFSKNSMIWINPSIHSLTISLMVLMTLNQTDDVGLTCSPTFFSDPLSTPLLILTAWRLPLMMMASQKHLAEEPLIQKYMYILMLISLQSFLIMTFSATELIMFYILFEATLIPTLIIITWWGNQTERLNAGTYFLFYTLVGSLPLLVALIYIQKSYGSLNFIVSMYQTSKPTLLLIKQYLMTSMHYSIYS